MIAPLNIWFKIDAENIHRCQGPSVPHPAAATQYQDHLWIEPMVTVIIVIVKSSSSSLQKSSSSSSLSLQKSSSSWSSSSSQSGGQLSWTSGVGRRTCPPTPQTPQTPPPSSSWSITGNRTCSPTPRTCSPTPRTPRTYSPIAWASDLGGGRCSPTPPPRRRRESCERSVCASPQVFSSALKIQEIWLFDSNDFPAGESWSGWPVKTSRSSCKESSQVFHLQVDRPN